ncbi:phosphatidylinositol 3-kinase-like protein [Lepidopterella palustris CBS 459.81]|uniref:Phosphatidylinositol 3-kinase VPS34 n=1 Tax=Lepidopterella palustris CBS 459.81 TaxID=1314670 RepID=A0A8E2EFP5_9PEZI|nr:phosphatidylinositol 3-kinase-like protein [Lepidopterella palustris CBS 459.81]
MEPFSFATSSALNLPVNVRIDRLDGHQKPIAFSTLLKRPDLRHRASNLSPNSELYITAQLWADSKPLTVPIQTAYKVFKNARIWNEWLTLPITYSNLPLSSQLAITVWDLSPTCGEDSKLHSIPFGGTTIPLFDKDNTLQKGRQRCKLYRNVAADGLSSSTTPWIPRPVRASQKDAKDVERSVDENTAEMERLEGLLKKQEMGEIPPNPWLDQMVFRQMMKLRSNALKTKAAADDGSSAEHDEEKFYLHVEFPRFDHPIVFTDQEYPAPPISSMQLSASTEVRLKPPPEVSFGPGINVDGNGYGDTDAGRLIRIYDPEVGRLDNPAENKHRRLVRSHRTGVLDRDLKPNAKIRDELSLIMAYGPTHELNAEEKDSVWKFRHHLCREKKALTKFVKSVAWGDQNEARQAVQILPKWAETDIDDALELLGPQFDNPAVRAYAVDRLGKADDAELQVYLLQLVQALKFETVRPAGANSDETEESSLAKFLISRAVRSFELGNFLHWYLMVECDDRSPEQGEEHRKLFARVEYDFMVELEKLPDGPARRKTLLRQAELITVLSKISKDIRFAREGRPQKIARLKKLLADPKNELVHIDPPLPLPLNPSIAVTSICPDECSIFKSSLFPLLLTFRTSNGTKYQIIFKSGDDLRQDQLVMQIITLMDRLLLQEKLDLKLSPYRILATSTSAGAVQFVPSMSLAAACQKYKGGLLAYLRANNPDDAAPLGVRKEAMDTYVKSCAGYCVITYLLGVGDRHLDNLLLAPDGHFFHVDFGYILGRDPKPFAPLMKLCREMVDGMGGDKSQFYAQFKEYCYTAYSTLRKSSNLIVNLFALMREANIPDIRIEPDKAVWKVQERLCLDLSEEDAIRHFEQLIETSSTAVMPVVIDRLHGFVQNWRA